MGANGANGADGRPVGADGAIGTNATDRRKAANPDTQRPRTLTT